MIIAIDGVSGSGKSTLAKEVAKMLNFGFFSTGYFYRAITYQALKLDISPEDDKKLNIMMDEIELKLIYDGDGNNIMYLDGEDVTKHLHNELISSNVAKYSQKPYVREKVRVLQRDTKNYNEGIVMEGRDIGSQIFPDADLKIYVTCSASIRAERRMKDCVRNGEYVSKELIEQELIQRDFEDIHRKICPLKKCEDALVVDTSHKTIQECLIYIVSNAQKIEKRQNEEKSIMSYFENFHNKNEQNSEAKVDKKEDARNL